MQGTNEPANASQSPFSHRSLYDMGDQEPAPPGAGAEEELQPPGMEEEAAPAKTEEPAAAPDPAPAASAPAPAASEPATTPVSASQGLPTTSEPVVVAQPAATSEAPVATASAAPVAAPVAAPAAVPVAQYAPYGYGAYPGYAPSMPVAGYGYDPAAAAYWAYYGHPAPTGDPSSGATESL